MAEQEGNHTTTGQPSTWTRNGLTTHVIETTPGIVHISVEAITELLTQAGYTRNG